jgi:D-3-phosphoglycerate dehydrogenase / 2-oxoglutarate reductase
MKRRILFADTTHPILPEMLGRHGFDCILEPSLTQQDFKSLIPGFFGLVIRSRFRIDREIIDLAPDLKFIGRVGAGMENIDTAYAESHGIACLNSPEGNKDALGEHCLGMLLALFNRFLIADPQVRQGKWPREENRGIELMGKTIGIIGYGNMGPAFAQRLKGFGCIILVYDKYKSGFGGHDVTETGMDQIFAEADVVSLHLPLTGETEYLVNEDWISRFRKDIYLINSSRGKIVDTQALADAIGNGRIAGAALDVLEYEDTSFEFLKDLSKEALPAALKYLVQSDKVIFTPHIAGWSRESAVKLAEVLGRKIIDRFI